MGASLLVFKNKSDVPGAMSEDEVRQVRRRGVKKHHTTGTLSGQ
jgi:ADP-ribosylation factor-like protein 2